MVEWKSFHLGDFYIVMGFREKPDDYNGVLEMCIHNAKTNKFQFLKFQTVGNFKAMGEQLVKRVIREMK